MRRLIRTKSRTGILTREDVNKEILKRKLDLKSVERILKLQEKFQLSKGSKKNRAAVKRAVGGGKSITAEAKRSLKVFELKTSRGPRFIAGVPKGIKILKTRTRGSAIGRRVKK